jgi:hypothetical protein
MPAITVTLDTTVVRPWLSTNETSSGFQKLLELKQQDKIDLIVTRRIYEDIPHEPLKSRINKLTEIGIRIEDDVIRFDISSFDTCMFGDNDFFQFTSGSEPSDIRWRDFDHVHAHYLLKRDVFLTHDNDLLDLQEAIKSRFNIRILRVGAFLKQFDAK